MKNLYDENVYQRLQWDIEEVVNFKMTEFEAGLFRALLDIKTTPENSGAALGSKFKKDISRLIKSGLIHEPSFKYAGMAIPTGQAKVIILQHIERLKTPEFEYLKNTPNN